MVGTKGGRFRQQNRNPDQSRYDRQGKYNAKPAREYAIQSAGRWQSFIPRRAGEIIILDNKGTPFKGIRGILCLLSKGILEEIIGTMFLPKVGIMGMDQVLAMDRILGQGPNPGYGQNYEQGIANTGYGQSFRQGSNPGPGQYYVPEATAGSEQRANPGQGEPTGSMGQGGVQRGR
ncbi:hypothetical protein V6N12_033729 [Hibiscus sabdariffa]|uniref:Uncharacterized protein n=1 Tax=Hibiscus sabdariffa TaxID=183260 RepID=A0ABR1Z7F4_9ROSI